MQRFDRFFVSRLPVFSNQFSITSQTAAGKTTCLKGLREKLEGTAPYRWVSGGALMRAKAESLGMTIEEFATFNREHPEEGYDRWLDQTIAVLGQHNWVVCESRLSHVFMPSAFKVLLKCEPMERARRRAKDNDGDVDKALQKILGRDRDDNERYERLYPGCLWPDSDFDLVIDTTHRSDPCQSVNEILESHRSWLAGKGLGQVSTGATLD